MVLAAADTVSLGYAICAVSFVVAAVLAQLSQLVGLRKGLMVIGCLLTAGWAASQVAEAWFAPGLGLALGFEVVRTLCWLAFLGAMLDIGASFKANRRVAGSFGIAAIAGVPLAIALLRGLNVPWTWVPAYGLLFLSVLGLLLLENLFRNCGAESRWGVKYVCLGLGAIFVYDFYFYADSALTVRFDANLLATRGFVTALAVPFLALSMSRGASWSGEVRISRQVVYHSAVLLGCGLYLLAMSAAGTVLRSVGGGWGPVLQGVFLAAAVLMMMVVFSSASFRSRLRVLVNKHFFHHKFDYREVWLNFIQQISREEGAETLHGRTLHAVADVLDCPAGALWVLQPEDDAFFATAAWNFGGTLPVTASDSPLLRFLRDSAWIVDIGEVKSDPARYDGLILPDWLLQHPRAWAVVPLLHRGRLEAFLVLGHPRNQTKLGWEERDLLKTLGAQAASYLSEERTSRALLDARRLEDFNQRFAFVIHDIKNIVSQMSLMIDNAKQHGDNPEFQRDMLATVENSVGRMRNMLIQLAADREREPAANAPLDLVPLLLRTYERWRLNHQAMVLGGLPADMPVLARKEVLISVLDHLIQNAVEASKADGLVEIGLRRDGRDGVIEVRDEGAGMDANFIRTKLFRPLDSWKSHGMGLGAFQARQLVRSMGGRLEVDSRPGQGTTMRVRLPLAAEQPVQAERNEGRA